MKQAKGGPGRGFYLGLAVIAIAGVGLLAWQASKPKQVVSEIDTTLPKMEAQGHVIGSPTAKLEVIEFADFECPGCGQFATLTEPDIRTRLVNTGLIRMRFIDYPLPMHKNTWHAHRAAWCAADQNKFWEMHDAIYANQDSWNGEVTSDPDKVLLGIAKGVGLDEAKYQQCIDTKKYQAQIQANMAEAEKRGIDRTPSFIIGSKKISGGMPYDDFKKAVDAELATIKP